MLPNLDKFLNGLAGVLEGGVARRPSPVPRPKTSALNVPSGPRTFGLRKKTVKKMMQ